MVLSSRLFHTDATVRVIRTLPAKRVGIIVSKFCSLINNTIYLIDFFVQYLHNIIPIYSGQLHWKNITDLYNRYLVLFF